MSSEDKDFIAHHCDQLSYEEIAKELKRNPETVRRYIRDVLKRTVSKTGSTLVTSIEIQKQPIWQQIQSQFSEEECRMFITHWVRIVGQYKDDLLPTEELQVVEYIKLELLSARALKEMNDCKLQIEGLDKQSKKALNKSDTSEYAQLQTLIASLNTSKNSLNKVYNDFLDKRMKMLQELKSTRADRIKSIESSKENIVGWISQLMRNTALRRELGEYMEKMRVAIDLEKVRLIQPYKYMDGEIESPLLNADAIELQDREHEEENGLRLSET